MPLFVVTGIDKPDGLETRLANRNAHFAYLQTRPGVVRLGGPFLDDHGAMVGSMLVIEVENIDAARAFVADDPYSKAGLFAETQVRPWRLSIGALG